MDTQLQHVAEAKVKDALGVVGVELHKQTDAAKLTREINDELCHLTSDLNQAKEVSNREGGAAGWRGPGKVGRNQGCYCGREEDPRRV